MTQMNRPDMDIEEDIRNLIAHYPPLTADRHQLRLEAHNGNVILSGHVKSLITRRYLVDRVREIAGVRGVNADQLYCEETIRIDAGRPIPQGVIANAIYGTVVLTGTLPTGTSAESVVKDVALIPGVLRVVTKFQSSGVVSL
jgi:osmotically-inducible protein OsmY